MKYVGFLGDVGCWRHPVYVLKKRALLEDPARRTDPALVWEGNQRERELLPRCVVDMVRGLYPNLPGRCYDGEAPFFKIQQDKKKAG